MIVIIFIDCVRMMKGEATAKPYLKSSVLPPQNLCSDIYCYSESDWLDGALPASHQPSLLPVPNSLAVVFIGGKKCSE